MCLSSEDIHQILRNHLKSNDFEFVSCEKSLSRDVSVGFLSAQEKLSIKYRNQGEEKELCVFVKMLPESPFHRQNIISSGGFHREVVLYNELFLIFNELIPDISIPKCFLARSDDILVLEDLSCKGFKNRNLYEPLDLEHCEITLQTIAKFHAASFITEKYKNCKLTDLVPVIRSEVFMSKESFSKQYVLTGIRALKKVTETYLAHYPTDLINKAFNYMDNLSDKMRPSEVYPNALSHSDLWTNNILFRYDDNRKLREVRIVDFQLTTYKALSYDIQLFLHTCTVRELRDKHYKHLLKYYFNSLEKQLSLSNINIVDLMSWSDFENMLKETLPVVISITPLFLHYILMPSNVVHDIMYDEDKFKYYFEIDRSDNILCAMEENEHYKQRLLQAMTEFINFFNSN